MKAYIKYPILCLSAVVTGLTVCFILPSFLEFVSIVPMLCVLLLSASGETQKKSLLRRGLKIGFVYFYAYYLTVWHWLLRMYPLEFTGMDNGTALLVVIVAWAGLALLQAVGAMWQIPLFLCMSRSPLLRREDGQLRAFAPASFAAVYVFFEWIQTLTWAGVPWGRLAIGQCMMPEMIASSSLFGSYAVSLVVVLVNAYLAYAILSSRKEMTRKAAASVLAAVLIVVFNYVYGAVSIYVKERETPVRTSSVALLQGNVSTADKWRDGSYANLFSIYESLTAKASSLGADSVLFPETALPGYINTDDGVREDVERLADKYGVEIIGTSFWELENDGGVQNAVYIVSPDGEIDTENVYFKRHLVPFGEFVPYKEFCSAVFPPLSELGMMDISKGEDGSALSTERGMIGALVCFDSIYESAALDEVKAGAELLAVSTNDSWFDGSAAVYQHAAQSVLRAVELDRYVCRAGNTGYSCVISPTGRIEADIDPLTRGVAISKVEFRSTRTLYSYVGNILAYLCGVWCHVCAASGIYHYIKRHAVGKRSIKSELS